MHHNEIYTKNEIEKLGNTLIFLCEKMGKLSKTHLLKLIYIVEEISIAKLGVPFFDLKFNVWKLGPVSTDLFAELSDESVLLTEYIQRDDTSFFIPKKPFSDDEFNDNEIDLLSTIADRFMHCTAKELINHTHRKDSLWYKTAMRNGVLESLEKGERNTTEIEIKMGEILEGDEAKLLVYNNYIGYLNQSKTLKA